VQAFNTVTVRAQVSGQLVKVPFKEGDEVRTGDLLAQVDPRSYQAALDQAVAKKAQDQATLNSARLDLKRYLDLLPDGYVSGQQVDQQRALIQQYEAQVAADEAALEAARVNLSYTRVTAPIDGVAGIRRVDLGNIVSASDSTGIVVLTQVKPIALSFTVPEQALAQIRAAPPPLTVVAVSRDNQAEIARGQLIAFDSQIDQTTGTIRLKARFDNQDQKLWPGQFVNARLLVRIERQALTVPSQAVQLGPNGSFVYVARADQTAEMRSVEVAQNEGGVALIARGLAPGESVVTDGQSRLKPGSRIQAGDAAARQAGRSAEPLTPDQPGPATAGGHAAGRQR
jgi:multidrug efflux system membrane fusion protein